MEMKYTEAAVKEALRVVPQTAGGLRVNPETRKLAGYDIPAGYTLTADPRIPFLDPENYPEPEDYRPERFLPEGASAARTVSASILTPPPSTVVTAASTTTQCFIKSLATNT